MPCKIYNPSPLNTRLEKKLMLGWKRAYRLSANISWKNRLNIRKNAISHLPYSFSLPYIVAVPMFRIPYILPKTQKTLQSVTHEDGIRQISAKAENSACELYFQVLFGSFYNSGRPLGLSPQPEIESPQ